MEGDNLSIHKMEQIEKPQAVDYHSVYPKIARVVKENENLVFLQYSESQSHNLTWGHNAVKRFDTPSKAIDFLVKWNRNDRKKELEIKVHENFPSFFLQTSSKRTDEPKRKYSDIKMKYPGHQEPQSQL